MGQSEVRSSRGQTTLSNKSRITETVSVPASGLDDVVADLGIKGSQVAFVWCDTQGSEADVIASGRTLWNAGVPLYTELWPRGLASHGGSERLLDLAESTFAEFVGRDDLVDHGANAAAQPIVELRGVLDRLAGGRYIRRPPLALELVAAKLPLVVGSRERWLGESARTSLSWRTARSFGATPAFFTICDYCVACIRSRILAAASSQLRSACSLLAAVRERSRCFRFAQLAKASCQPLPPFFIESCRVAEVLSQVRPRSCQHALACAQEIVRDARCEAICTGLCRHNKEIYYGYPSEVLL